MEPDDSKALASQLFNGCWDLLENNLRTPDDDVTLLTLAFTSRYHWQGVGAPQQLAIADWMVSRSAAAVGFGDLAVTFAERAARSSEGQADWLVASAAEGLARAYAAAGDTAKRNEWADKASALVEVISDAEERALIAEQLASVPE